MKKLYTYPTYAVLNLDSLDVLTTSGLTDEATDDIQWEYNSLSGVNQTN